MSILDKFKLKAEGKIANLGIGLGYSQLQNNKILNAAIKFISDHNSNIYFFGIKDSIDSIESNKLYKDHKSKISLVKTREPEEEILEYLMNNKLSGIVRGSLDSHKFLRIVKTYLKVREINRLALLETYNGVQFFFAPVGIDECNTLEKKISFLRTAIDELISLKIMPKISILSGGRKSDFGREENIDNSINDANKVVSLIQKEFPDIKISHDEILIENAIEKGSNLIIAPDGISGNLIYRTLVHLGKGNAYGAIYIGLEKTIIDTSRVGNISEILGALTLALALSK